MRSEGEGETIGAVTVVARYGKIGAVVVIRAVFHPNLSSQRAGQITLHDSAQSSSKPKS